MSTYFSKFNRTIFMTAFATCTAVMALGTAPPSFAADPSNQSIFELGPGQACDVGGALNAEDGVTNILGDGNCATPSAGPDWADLFVVNTDGSVSQGSNLFGGIVARFIQDQIGTSADDTTYTSQGSDTNSQHVNEWTWTTNSVPPKDDITNAYVYEKVVSGNKIIYVGAERQTPNGDSHIDFEFFQANIALDHTPPCPAQTVCKFTGPTGNLDGNTDGDILISMDFTNGGDLAGLSIRKRKEGEKSKQVDTVLGKIATGDNYILIGVVPAGCNLNEVGTTIPTVCAFSNQKDIDGGPWVNSDSQGNEIFTLPKNAFTEWGIDIKALGLTAACLPNVLVKTRSSQSITAQLKDFALRPFENCSASLKTEIHNVSHTDITGSTSIVGGTVIHDKVVITGSPAGGIPTGKVTFYRWDNDTCSGIPASTSAEINLTAGSPDTNGNPTAVAESPTYTTQSGQDISYFASYGGGGLYPAVPLPDTDKVPAASCEPLGVTTLASSVITKIRLASGTTIFNNSAVNTNTTTTPITPITVNVVDVAKVTATIPAGVTAPPLGDSSCSSPTSAVPGSVTFKKYTTADCTGTSVDQHVCVGTTSFTTTTAEATATSPVESLTGSEFLCFQAKYNGNAAYTASALSGKEPLCAFPFEPFTTF